MTKKDLYKIIASDDLNLLQDNETNIKYFFTKLKCKIWLMLNK